MKKIKHLILCFTVNMVWLCVGIGMLGESAFADNTRVTYPNAINVEAGGRALIYSITFDRALNENLVAGLGIGNASTANSGPSTWVVPVYLNYYLMQDAGSLFITAGADILTSNSVYGMPASVGSLQFNSNSPILGTFGLGYEYRSDAQFLVRLAAYGLVSGNLAPWGGVTFGYSF